MWLADLLRDPHFKEGHVDEEERFGLHRYTLSQKPMLRRVFTEFHQAFDRLDKEFLSGFGARIEIGSGVAPIRESYPDVLATDIVPGPDLDRLLDAEKMDLADESVRVLFGQNCFHHLANPICFFQELERVVAPGGGAILLEPYHKPFATFLFRRMFHSEGFDKDFPTWETPISGPMNGANQALSYIVFERDRDEFNRLFPDLEIAHQVTFSNYLIYLFSGGLNFRQLWPNWAAPMLSLIQQGLNPLDHWLALHHVLVIRRRA